MNLLNTTTITNYTDSGEIIGEASSFEDDVPLVESFDGSSEEHLGFVENSLLKMIPKFLKAMVTLLICGLLLGGTFLLIHLWKRGCRTHRKLEEEGKHKNGKPGKSIPPPKWLTQHQHPHPINVPLHSVIVTPPEDDEDEDDPRYIDDPIGPSSSSIQPIRSKFIKVPQKGMLRRASGPFGSEALSFVGEQYTMKNIEKEKHYHVPGRSSSPHPQQHPHFHSGHSSGGSTHNLDGGDTKSKIKNIFKGKH